MKLKQIDDINLNVDVELPTQDLEDLVETVATQAILVIGFYMAADSARHILKKLIK